MLVTAFAGLDAGPAGVRLQRSFEPLDRAGDLASQAWIDALDQHDAALEDDRADVRTLRNAQSAFRAAYDALTAAQQGLQQFSQDHRDIEVRVKKAWEQVAPRTAEARQSLTEAREAVARVRATGITSADLDQRLADAEQLARPVVEGAHKHGANATIEAATRATAAARDVVRAAHDLSNLASDTRRRLGTTRTRLDAVWSASTPRSHSCRCCAASSRWPVRRPRRRPPPGSGHGRGGGGAAGSANAHASGLRWEPAAADLGEVPRAARRRRVRPHLDTAARRGPPGAGGGPGEGKGPDPVRAAGRPAARRRLGIQGPRAGGEHPWTTSPPASMPHGGSSRPPSPTTGPTSRSCGRWTSSSTVWCAAAARRSAVSPRRRLRREEVDEGHVLVGDPERVRAAQRPLRPGPVRLGLVHLVAVARRRTPPATVSCPVMSQASENSSLETTDRACTAATWVGWMTVLPSPARWPCRARPLGQRARGRESDQLTRRSESRVVLGMNGDSHAAAA